MGIAQLAEHRTVAPTVAGSIPVSHPIFEIPNLILWIVLPFPRPLRPTFYVYVDLTAMSSHAHGPCLGLSLAGTLAEAMGGDLTVHSEIEKGTRFTVRLPVATEVNSSENLLSVKS